MTTHRLRMALVAAVAMIGSSAMMTSQAGTLDSILDVGKNRHKSAVKSQVKIDKLADETRDLLTDYKTVNKEIDGLKVYNARLEKQIGNQEKRIGNIVVSIQQVTVIQRQMTPLVIRMIDGLDKFVALDVPFHKEERERRVAFLRSNLDRSDVSVAEKFRQVLEAYKIEKEYGRKIDAYKGSIDIGGSERDVNFFRAGRVALLYQTTDTEVSGAWDQRTRSWVNLEPGEYRNAIMKALRIARKEASIDVLNMPILAPEAAK